LARDGEGRRGLGGAGRQGVGVGERREDAEGVADPAAEEDAAEDAATRGPGGEEGWRRRGQGEMVWV